MTITTVTFTELLLSHWQEIATKTESPTSITSRSLTLADVVSVARHLTQVGLTPEAIAAITGCSDIISEKLASGEVIYGVNTGFGGSADTRTAAVTDLQQALFRHLMSGVMAGPKPQAAAQTNGFSSTDHESAAPQAGEAAYTNGTKHTNGTNGTPRFVAALPLSDPLASTCMPESWARASMLVRLNSLAGGASGIRVCLAESLVELLNRDVVPQIPLRGSISASGDLGPLSYVGALMQGKPTATAYSGPRQAGGARRPVRADRALAEAGIEPIRPEAKEGLAIVNGTAVSAGVAALALHESLNLAALSQVLTAMSVEALNGTDESFEPFIARVRPHRGQVDSARNIFAFLGGSKIIASRASKQGNGELRQDRYSLRTAGQWIGPVLEDFMLAHEQITVELNSVTDNPLINASDHRVFHGGNFQARVVTSAVEKLRQGLQTIGRMLFSQCTELMNPATNDGLPPNLVSDAPSDSYLFKGVDVMTAGLTSELGFLANPVGSHVQTAEMGNQSLNSLALISARYTLDAVDVLSQLSAAHLLALCQALDLRVRRIDEKAEDATPYLGSAAQRVYGFVRKDLGVPFLSEAAVTGDLADEGVSPSVGGYVTVLYEAIRSGKLYNVVVECLQEV